MIIPVILSGGGGTRLWPLSRTHFPKQYWSLITDKTLLQETVLRVASTTEFNLPLVICNEEHRFLVAEQLRQINITPSNIVLENAIRNTAHAIALACLMHENSNALLLVLPADHVIQKSEAFRLAIAKGKKVAETGKIVTFGIVPDRPETRYGYIRKGKPLNGADDIFTIDQFIEKPPLDTAKSLLASGDNVWNSGIFLFNADVMLAELERLQPKLLAECQMTLNTARRDLDFLRLTATHTTKDHNLSIDHAVMEHTNLAAVIPVDMGWSDIGSWDALWEVSHQDAFGNVAIGDVVAQNVKNSYLRSDNQLLSVLGLDDVIVVATDDAILVADKNHVHQVKEVIQELRQNNRTELDSHKRVYRPWGYYQSIELGNRFQVKRLMIKPGEKTSTQIHFHRSEHWVVVEGTARVTKGEETHLIRENESIYIPMGVKHRVENPGKIPLHFIEVQSGAYLGEDDIIRIEDAYGRVGTNASIE